MSKYWQNKVAVITGASCGIGAKVALKLANAGVNVVGLARRTQLIDVSVNRFICDWICDFY